MGEEDVNLADAEPIEDGDALVIATSGSTGEPKGVVSTHRALEASATMTSQRLGVDPRNDRWLACIPLAHIGGFSVVSRSLLTDTPLSLAPRPSSEAIDKALAAGATLCSLVPTALEAVDVSCFREVLLGGGPIPDDRPANCIATYGSTETGSGIVYDGTALDGVEVRSVDGVLWVRSPTLGRCYRDGTAIVDAEGWHDMGDVGVVHGDGRVHVTGRAGNVIVTGGEKVWPSVVEERLDQHPAVSEVAVIGRPDSRWGAAVTAIVVTESGCAVPGLAALRMWVKETLPAYAAPQVVEVVSELPHLPGGKIDRRRL